MKYAVLAYKDTETSKFNPPMLFPMSEQDAIETIKDGTIKGKIEDADAFELYALGDYDTVTGTFELNKEPKKIFALSQYVRKA